MTNGVHLEICCASLEDCLTAQSCGADAIELVSAHLLGGLTPSAGLLELAKQRVSIPISAMLRPRGAGLCYSDEEFAVICADARRFAQMGADGLVFGFLTEHGSLDYERCARFMDCAGNCETVFHRAIDVTHEHLAVAEQLIKLGVTRILTSGGAQNALEGAPVIRQLQQQAGDRIQILAGGGVRAQNAAKLVEATGVRRLHLGGTALKRDRSTHKNPALDFGACMPEDRSAYPRVHHETISAVVNALGK